MLSKTLGSLEGTTGWPVQSSFDSGPAHNGSTGTFQPNKNAAIAVDQRRFALPDPMPAFSAVSTPGFSIFGVSLGVSMFRALALLAAFSAAASAQIVLNSAPTRVLGQPRLGLSQSNPNLVEGRELYQPQGVALDTTVSPPILYIADSGNNRVLAWRNLGGGANGAQADLVIGQRDFFSTNALGPGTTLSTGLASPTGVAVDRQGNLWVVDSGNNRILRYPRPFAQTSDIPFPDVVLGQTSLNARNPNAGNAAPVDNGFSLSVPGRTFRASLVFDSAGNLWVTDPNNHRVMRFSPTAQGRNGGGADLVLGQTDFVSRLTSSFSAAARSNKGVMNTPSALAIDTNQRVYVSDGFGRVLVYAPPFSNGVAATRILGISTTATPAEPVNNTTIGVTSSGGLLSAEGLFFSNSNLGVVDSAAHRILLFPAFEGWAAETPATPSPAATTVIGQTTFTAARADQGREEPQPNAFNLPIAAAVAGNELFVVDALNHRVLRLGTPPAFLAALQVYGQPAYYTDSPNYVEGREFFLTDGTASTIAGVSARFLAGTGMAFDGNRLYVADTLNHRVLAFRDFRALKNGDRADLVIGQPDFLRAVPNFPANDINVPSDRSLVAPSAVAVDTDGNLYVADAGNSRVLRFPKPFDVAAGQPQRANLVLGQANFTLKVTDATSATMSRPVGLAFFSDGSLAVSDANHSRVLLFRKPAGGDFTNGMAAARAFGQPDFLTVTGSSDARRMISPRAIAADSDDRLYVCDTGNSRLQIYDRAPSAQADPTPALTIGGFNSPHGVFVSNRTGEIWVGDTFLSRALRFPRYDQLVLNQNPEASIPSPGPIAVAQDQFGNLYIADASNRVVIHFPSMGIRQAANFLATNQRPLAPNTYASLGAPGVTLSTSTVVFTEVPNPLPMPKTLSDTQVLLDGNPAPLHFVSAGQINFLIPNGAPTSGNVEVLVVRPSSGQILAAGSMPMASVAPGLFTATGTGVGQISALNQDGTVNNSSNPAQRGTVIQLFGTGLGPVSGAPGDGEAPTGPVPGPATRAVVGTDFVPDANIQYSGLAPGLVGVWQVNIRLPETLAPGTVRIQLQIQSVTSSLPVASAATTIVVRQ